MRDGRRRVAGGQAQNALDAVKAAPGDAARHRRTIRPTPVPPRAGGDSTYPPGYKENAGIFCHNNPWIMIAETVLGARQAFEYWKQIAPAYREENQRGPPMEPYVYSQMIAGKDAPRARRGQERLADRHRGLELGGHHPAHSRRSSRLGGLRVDPCLPGSIGTLEVTRQCRGATYRIKVKNRKTGKSRRLTVDGTSIEGTLVRWAPEGSTVSVEVEV